MQLGRTLSLSLGFKVKHQGKIKLKKELCLILYNLSTESVKTVTISEPPKTTSKNIAWKLQQGMYCRHDGLTNKDVTSCPVIGIIAMSNIDLLIGN